MLRPSSPGRRRPPRNMTPPARRGGSCPGEALHIAEVEGRPDEERPSDRMTSDPTGPFRSTTFGSDGGACHHACAALAGGRTPHEAPRTRPRRVPAAGRRGAEPPGHRRLGGRPASPTATARRARSSSRCRTSRRLPWSPSRGIAHAALTGETPGEALDRLDLAKLRQLVDRVEARDADGSGARPPDERSRADAWLPGVDGALARPGLAAAPRVRRGRGRTQRAAHAERRARDRARHAQPARARAHRAEPRAGRHQPRRHRAARRARPAGAGAARPRGGQRELPGRADPRAAHAPLRGARHDRGDPARRRRRAWTPRLREDVRLIDGAMEEALDLVNDHLDLARLAAGREVVRVTEVHVDELFSALRGIVVHLPRSPDVTVVFEELNGVPTLRTDAFKLSQILRNYVVNGLKFTERGEVRVSAAAVDAGTQVRFAVADTGPGLEGHRPVADLRGVRPARAARRGRRAARLGPGPVDLQAPGDTARRRGRRHQRAGPRHDLHGDHPGDLHARKRGRGGRGGGVTRGPRGRLRSGL